MITISLAALIAGIVAAKLNFSDQKRKVKKYGETRLNALRVVNIIMPSVCSCIIAGMVGYLTSSVLPAPPRPVEERVVVESLLPFQKDNETDPTFYSIRISGDFFVRYDDGSGRVVTARCCNNITPKIVEIKDTEDNHASIKRYHSPAYFGWFSFRSSRTWYEIRVPSRVPEQSIPLEILR
ncbi:MAG: hypothetical protein HYS15_00995 [Candidatus Spechtbacteria bacterium]|nr:hypothetical protein [Candidatus Spechtbacteria bacterium]